MFVDRVVVSFVLTTLVGAVSAVAGLAAGILHHMDGASMPYAVRAGGRAALAVLGVQLPVLAVLVALYGR